MRMWTKWAMRGVAVGCGLLPGLGWAQDAVEEAPPPRTLVMARLLDVLYSTAGVNLEHAVSPHWTVAGTVRATLSLNQREQPIETHGQSWGVGLEPGAHYYFAGRAPEGFWLGPHLETSVRHVDIESAYTNPGGQPYIVRSNYRTLQYGASLRTGYTAVVGRGLALQVGVDLVALATRNTLFTGSGLDSGATGGRSVSAQQIGSLLGSLGPQDDGWTVIPRLTLALGGAF